MNEVLRCEGLGVSFGYRRVLDNLDMVVGTGEFVVVSGPSGSGKSTLLRLFCRLQEPDHGIVRFEGRKITSIPAPELRRRIGYVQQTPVVVQGSVRDNLMLAFDFRRNADMRPPEEEQLRSRLAELNLDVGLQDDAAGLSVGQRQRLALLRTLLMRPKVLLMDEPTSALDAQSARLVLDEAERLCREEGVSVVMITHSGMMPDIEHAVVVVDQGKAVRQ